MILKTYLAVTRLRRLGLIEKRFRVFFLSYLFDYLVAASRSLTCPYMSLPLLSSSNRRPLWTKVKEERG